MDKDDVMIATQYIFSIDDIKHQYITSFIRQYYESDSFNILSRNFFQEMLEGDKINHDINREYIYSNALIDFINLPSITEEYNTAILSKRMAEIKATMKAPESVKVNLASFY